ncbi:DUF2927 domain-containing protein [Sulfitobacter sabulilitoris]|uniref:DUF2927 domain-containing protein n=1 Tax=Sulfitobacter sabulilitoris TaxID=2562655 RepID=A0A5S3Q597_9RHOB|nr:DUF2927 domain-containing protein [Sulfitobacter sabulilitoris]TMM51842.1 DUF2927 domain-containing protein [Sulfitobacter sabulilitoris]
MGRLTANIRRGRVLGGLCAAAATLAACGALPPVDPVLTPRARPAGIAKPVVVAQPTSIKSAMLRSYLNEVQRAQVSQGLLRRDGGGPDTPFTADMLARNFEQIVFYNEYDSDFKGRGGQSPLRRWTGPVRMKIIFGDSIPPSQRDNDDYDVRQYANRLSRATGHQIATTGEPNFLVIIAGEDDRAAALEEVPRRIPEISDKSLNALRSLRRDTYCVVAAFAAGPDASTYTAAVAVIRAENPDLLRLSCIHEELAQGLGLANDSPAARPSIFNDDDEFALLTTHDEMLLKMLYDPRLRPGMTAQEAAPIVRILARELTTGPL